MMLEVTLIMSTMIIRNEKSWIAALEFVLTNLNMLSLDHLIMAKQKSWQLE